VLEGIFHADSQHHATDTGAEPTHPGGVSTSSTTGPGLDKLDHRIGPSSTTGTG
jgi:hypothetical protein